MTQDKTHNYKVGIFVLVAVIVFMVTVVIIGGNQLLFKKTSPFLVHFEHVQGMAIGSTVSLAGIPVGNVTHIKFHPKKEGIIVTLNIDSNYIHKITEKSIASVRTKGALGDKYIYITAGDLNTPPLNANSYIQAEPQKDIFELFTKNGDKFASMGNVIEEVHTLIKTINENQRSENLMQNLVDATGNLNKILIEWDEQKKHVDKGFKSLTNILEKIDNGKGTLGALINDPTVHNRIVKILGESPRNTYLKPLIRATIKDSESTK